MVQVAAFSMNKVQSFIFTIARSVSIEQALGVIAVEETRAEMEGMALGSIIKGGRY